MYYQVESKAMIYTTIKLGKKIIQKGLQSSNS